MTSGLIQHCILNVPRGGMVRHGHRLLLWGIARPTAGSEVIWDPISRLSLRKVMISINAPNVIILPLKTHGPPQGMMGALVIMLLSGGILNGLTPNLGDVKRDHQWYLEVCNGQVPAKSSKWRIFREEFDGCLYSCPDMHTVSGTHINCSLAFFVL